MPDQPTPPGVRRSILFVCTGNTCRSPLAAAVCRRLLADRLGVPEGDLEGRGFVVQSAGIAALPGDAASPDAVTVAGEYGADLTQHRSRPVNPELLAAATDVIAMTAGHAALLMMRFPGVGPEPRLLVADGQDLPDPFGGDLEIYRMCGQVIAGQLTRLTQEWLGS
jgi:protein-tyrosine-phosphatase